MTKILLILPVFILLISSCSEEETISADRAFLLAGDEMKDWRIAGASSDATETRPSCKTFSPRVQDNTFTFFADGSMEWDHGEIVEDESDPEGCSDFKNLLGSWYLIDNDTKLVWDLERNRDDPSDVFDVDPDTINIVMIHADSLVLAVYNNEGEQEWTSFTTK